jgi:putative FmdB family regulatory protein
LALEGAECQSPFHKLRNILTETAEDRVPTYQYACTECGHFFEQFQSFTDDALTECPVCSGKLRKVFNAVGVVFKGSGFYRNDSRASSSEKSEGGSKEKAASTTDKSSSGEKSSSTTSSSTAAAS